MSDTKAIGIEHNVPCDSCGDACFYLAFIAARGGRVRVCLDCAEEAVEVIRSRAVRPTPPAPSGRKA